MSERKMKKKDGRGKKSERGKWKSQETELVRKDDN